MKKFFLALILFLSFAPLITAQIPGASAPVSLYAGGAVTMPNAPDEFNEVYKPGYHFFGGLGLKMIPMIQLVGKAEMTRLSYDFGGAAGLDGGTNTIWMFGGDARYSLNVPAFPFKPFAFAGAGMASVTADDITGSDQVLVTALNDAIPDETQNEMYWNIGAGMEFKLGPMMTLFAQGRYVSVATAGDPTILIPVSVGLKFF